jgi:4-hydroxy-tetrahydrodipicolinate synthase
VYAGIGDNCIADSIAAGREYLESGVDAVVAYLPSYYLLQPPEMQRHFEHLIHEIPGRLMIYNILQTTHMSIPVETVLRLAERPNIIGFKDSENTPGRPEAIARQLGGRPGFAIYMGTSLLSVHALRLGFDGLVPGSGNLVPGLWKDLFAAARAGKWAEAETLQTRLNAIAAVFQKGRTLGQSLAAMKTMMAAMGLCPPHMLAPLAPMDEAATKAIRAEMAALQLI